MIYVCAFVLIAYGVLTGSHTRTPIQPANGIEQEFLIYPGSNVVASTHLDFPRGAQLVLESKEARGRILGFYRQELENNGWAVRLEREDFLALFKDNRALMIQTEGPLEGTAKVTLIMAELEEGAQ